MMIAIMKEIRHWNLFSDNINLCDTFTWRYLKMLLILTGVTQSV